MKAQIHSIVIVVAFLLLLCACNADDAANVLPDGDLDLDSEPAAETDLTLDAPETEEAPPGDPDIEPDLEGKDGDADLPEAEPETETPIDGDLDALESDPEEVDSIDAEDGDAEIEWVELELEPEEEQEPPLPTCEYDSDPLELVRILDEPRFGSYNFLYNGEIRHLCQTDGFLIAGRKGMEVTVRIRPYTTTEQLIGRLMIYDQAAVSHRREPTVLFEQQAPLWPEEIETRFTLPYSGEYLVLVSGKDYSFTGKYELLMRCDEGCNERFTRFPIVLLHGMGGFDEMLGLLNYFNGVEDDLLEQGYDVHVTEVAMFNDSNYRAEELERQLVEILDTTAARKLNLVAHSQGGLDGRHFISVMGHGDDVSVLAMVSTPNRGVIIGDMILGTVQGVSREVITAIFDFFSDLIDASDSDIEGALSQISVEAMANDFNPKHPDDPRVRYWSWAGRTCGSLDRECRSQNNDEAVNPVLALTYNLILDGPDGVGSGPNDGMVPLSSAMWGEWQGELSADHADEIGQLKTGDFDHKQLYRDICNKLVVEGY